MNGQAINGQSINEVSDVVINSVVKSENIATSSSVFDIFWNSGIIVKFVILLLLAASIWSWTIIISKYFKLRKLKIEADDFENKFWSGGSLESLFREIRGFVLDPFSNVFCAAMAEWDRLFAAGGNDSVERRVGKIAQIKQAMQIAISKEIEDLERNITFLSTLGTNGVIVGILGMVVGIMDGMKTIAINQSVGMAAVAPIISESLFTTALGLFAAIPAAVMYNKMSNDINKYIARLETFAEEFCSIIARQID
jgi:biopolymer transport protein TolQ